MNNSSSVGDAFAVPHTLSAQFQPESLLERPISERNQAFAAFIAGCLVSQDVIPFQSLKDEPANFMHAMLIIGRCLDMLPADGDWPNIEKLLK
jgi:hypothetical protein